MEFDRSNPRHTSASQWAEEEMLLKVLESLSPIPANLADCLGAIRDRPPERILKKLEELPVLLLTLGDEARVEKCIADAVSAGSVPLFEEESSSHQSVQQAPESRPPPSNQLSLQLRRKYGDLRFILCPIGAITKVPEVPDTAHQSAYVLGRVTAACSKYMPQVWDRVAPFLSAAVEEDFIDVHFDDGGTERLPNFAAAPFLYGVFRELKAYPPEEDQVRPLLGMLKALTESSQSHPISRIASALISELLSVHAKLFDSEVAACIVAGAQRHKFATMESVDRKLEFLDMWLKDLFGIGLDYDPWSHFLLTREIVKGFSQEAASRRAIEIEEDLCTEGTSHPRELLEPPYREGLPQSLQLRGYNESELVRIVDDWLKEQTEADASYHDLPEGVTLNNDAVGQALIRLQSVRYALEALASSGVRETSEDFVKLLSQRVLDGSELSEECARLLARISEKESVRIGGILEVKLAAHAEPTSLGQLARLHSLVSRLLALDIGFNAASINVCSFIDVCFAPNSSFYRGLFVKWILTGSEVLAERLERDERRAIEIILSRAIIIDAQPSEHGRQLREGRIERALDLLGHELAMAVLMKLLMQGRPEDALQLLRVHWERLSVSVRPDVIGMIFAHPAASIERMCQLYPLLKSELTEPAVADAWYRETLKLAAWRVSRWV